MNAREAMQALLDGKIVTDEWGYKLKVSDQGTLVTNRTDGTWRKAVATLNDDLQIVEEYPLTFREALKAMLDGKIVQPDYKICGEAYFYKFDNVVIKRNWGPQGEWISDFIGPAAQKSKWKVVE